MKMLLIDTGAFFAQHSPTDEYHELATRGFAELATSSVLLYTTEHILDETLTLLARRENYAYAAEAGDDLLNSRVLQWLDTTDADLAAALKFMRKYADQAVSFTDCISFALMKRENIRDVFGFDRHFRAAGFRLWPRDS